MIKQRKPPAITAEDLFCNFFLYPTQLVIPSVVAIAVKKLMAI